MEEKDKILISKLDEFIRRYYKSQLIKGSIYAGGIIIISFLTVIFLEYFGEFNSSIRAFLFFGFITAGLAVFSKYIIVPLLKLNHIGSVLSYSQAAEIIGAHFSNVQDKLINVLQLQNNRVYTGSHELLLAGIDQKIRELSPIPFAKAVDLNESRKHLRTLVILSLCTLGIIYIWPQIVSRSTTRLVNFQTYYEKDMPFQFEIQNNTLRALQTDDYKLQIKLTGSEIPDEVFLQVNGVEYKLEKENPILFHYTFTNIQNSTSFQLQASGYLSKKYELEVLPKPTLLNFNIQLIYPSYINKPNESISNTGDLLIPEGTKVNWEFHTRNTNSINLHFSDSSAFPNSNAANEFKFSRRFLKNNSYTIKASNNFVSESPDSVNYSINIVPDQYPAIDVKEQKDSLNSKNIYFSGQIKDDYGFSKLYFHFNKFSQDSNGVFQESSGSFPIPLLKGQISQAFFYFLDGGKYNLNSGDRIEYFFEVYDNDGVNGAKKSKTQTMIFKAPTRDEIKEVTDKNNSEIKSELEESIKKAKQLQKDVNEISKKINEKNKLGYDEKKKLEELLKKQQDLQSKVEEIKRENEANNKQQNEFNQTDESILEKQKQLEQLFENIMTPEMKKLFDELNKMLDKLDKNQVQEKLDELKLTNKDIEKELERNLEAFKQLEVAQKMQEAIDKLDELQKKEELLNKETEGKKQEDNKQEDKKQEGKEDQKNKDEKENKQKDSDEKSPHEKKEDKADSKELEKKQEEIKQDFEKLKEELKELEKKNKALEEPNKLPNTEQKQEEISKELQNSADQLSQNKKKSAAKSQKSAAEKMEEMKEEMQSAMDAEEEKQEEENAQALRQILENLVNLSFAQEELIKVLPLTRIDNPQYLSIPKQQNTLKDDSKIIEDSLLALSKRAPEISAIVNREISAIHLSMEKTVAALAERNTGESAMRMQSTMTSVNNLALLLNEVLEQMQEQMKQQSKAKGQKGGKCKKPGSGSGGKPSKKGSSAGDMRKLQEQLNRQLQDLKDALENGQKPGEKPGDKQGQKPGSGSGQNGQSGASIPGSSEQFAKMAAQQEALRRQMQAMMEKLKNKGANPGGDIANMMEETERELVNKQITNSTLKRQQDILSRLLESEKAEREREQDEQRKSNEAKSQNYSNPSEFLEYKRQKEKEMELLNTVPPSLTPYYKEKVDKYFNSLNNE